MKEVDARACEGNKCPGLYSRKYDTYVHAPIYVWHSVSVNDCNDGVFN